MLPPFSDPMESGIASHIWSKKCFLVSAPLVPVGVKTSRHQALREPSDRESSVRGSLNRPCIYGETT